MVRHKSRFLILIGLVLLILALSVNNPQAAEKDRYFSQRQDMVRDQIQARGITDRRVLKAMMKVRRDQFVPFIYRALSYQDSPLPIGEGQTISQPYIVALMTEVLRLKPQDKVLEVGTGSGYQAAVLAEIVKEVYTIEIFKSLTESAEIRLKQLGYKNIKVKSGDGYLGWPEYAAFDAIIVTCAPEDIPRPLLEQLADGGRIVIPVGKQGSIQELVLITKKEGSFIKTVITGCRFVPMLGIAQQMP